MEYCVRKLIPKTPKFIIKTIINYFIGSYLVEELHESQIEVIQNYAECTNIDLNIKVINDSFEKQNIPLNVLYGFIGCIRIYLPGCAIDGKLLFEISDLEISLGPAARSTTPDPDIVFGTMVDSMINMQRSLQQEDFSNFIFEEKQKGKNFNALISKWISKLCLTLYNTKISFESRPIPQINRCCRFMCEIEKLEFATRDIDTVNMGSSALLGILLANNIELTGLVLRWEVASQKSDNSINRTSLTDSTNEILYGSQILSIINPIQVNYTLLLNNTEPEFEVNINLDTVHILLSPLPLHWIQVLTSQIMITDFDPSISKNVKMTESQFDSFFVSEEKQSASFRSLHNDSSIYYDVDSTFDGSSIHGAAYDDVALDNGDDDNQYQFQKDTATCASLSSNITIFDNDGKMNTNFKACISTKNICVKVLLRNPSEDTDSWDYPGDLFEKVSDNDNWDYNSKKFFGLLKTFNKSLLSYEELIKFHAESGDIDYFSLFIYNVVCSVTNKKYFDKFHQSFLFSADSLKFSETTYDSLKDPDIMQVLSVVPIDTSLDQKALDIKAEYNPSENEVSFEISLGRCYFGIDISMQDRVRPLMQNNIIEYSMSDKTNSYELNRATESNLSVGCIIVVNASSVSVEVFIPLVNLNEEMFSKSYWQYRRLHSETILLSMTHSRWLCRIPSTGRGDDKSYSPHTVVELYAPSVIISLCTVDNTNLEIINLVNESEDFATVSLRIKSKLEQHIDNTKDTSKNQYDSIFPYCNAKLSKKCPLKPYSTKESSKNNSTPKVVYTPESEDKIKQYIKKAINNSYLEVDIVSSTVVIEIRDKSVLEMLYDRLVFDLALWEPNFDKRTNDVIINYKPKEAMDTDEEANTDTSYDEDIHCSQRKSKNKFQPKKFTCKLQSECCICYLQLNSSELSESVVELKGIQFFTDSDIVQGLVETQSMCIVEVKDGKIFHTDIKSGNGECSQMRVTTLSLGNNYTRVLDRLQEHIRDGCNDDPKEKLMIIIMESQISKIKRTSKHCNRAKQNASTIVTANFNDACLRVNYVDDKLTGLEWLLSLSDLFTLNTPVIVGYTLPDSDMTMYLHSKNCAMDLCFSQLPMSVFALLNKVEMEINLNSTESYCLSSEVCFNGSQLFIRSNDSISFNSYFRWDNDLWLPRPLLDEGFVYVMDVGSLDLRFNKIGSTNYAEKTPNCTLSISNSATSIHLCADSLNMIITCLSQMVSQRTEPPSHVQSSPNTTPGVSTQNFVRRVESLPALNEKQKTHFNTMINDAMKENKLSLKNKKRDSDEFCDDFILVEDIFSNVHDRVINLENNPSQKLSVVQDHYKSLNSEDKYGKMKRAIFKDPDGYPNVENSLVIHDFSLSFYFYAGYDFGETNELKKSSQSYSKTMLKPSMNVPIRFQRFSSDNVSKVSIGTSDFDAYFGEVNTKTVLTRGGSNRKTREAYNWRFSKINFRYALFSHTDRQRSVTCNNVSRRLVFIVNTVEIMSQNKSSGINKILFCDTNATLWYDPKSPMISMKIIFTESDHYHDVVNEECDIKISIQPIRLNVDQEFILFSEKFYKDLNANDILKNKVSEPKAQRSCSTSTLPECIYQEKDSILIPPNINLNKELGLGRGGGIDSISGCSPISRTSTLRMPAFDEMRSKNGSGEKPQPVNSARSLSTIFIRNFSIYPDIYVKLDYTGTRLDLTQGAIKGLFYILMQLNNVVLVIKNKQYLEGITGLDILISILMKDITEEFYAQLKSIFSKVGPISEVTEILTGIYDFFTLPYLHYQHEGGLIEGIKLGTRSITTTSLWAALTLLSKGLKIFQKMAETTYDLVSPADIEHVDESYHSARDIREGVNNAAHGVRQRFRNTAADFQHAFVKSDRVMVGRIGDVIRQVPPALASPIVATCEATNHLVDGLRYQLKPEMKIEDEKKWKH